MDHQITADVEIWQQDIQQNDETEFGSAYYLFETSTTAFSSLLHTLASNHDNLDYAVYEPLRREFRKFYLWHQGFATSSGDLDHILSNSKNLKTTVLSLMVLWGRAVLKLPKVLHEYDLSTISPRFVELEVIASKTDQVAKAALVDMKSQFSFAGDADFVDDFDSDTESTLNEETFDDVLDDLNAYMESLSDITSSLDHPASDFFGLEEVSPSLTNDLSMVSEPCRPFVLIIKDRFPSLDSNLVRKLGEANWQRRLRISDKLASAFQMDEHACLGDGDSTNEDTVVDSKRRTRQGASDDRITTTSTVRFSVAATSNFQSITTASDFSEPSIFDRNSIYTPAARRSRPAESVTSFATSLADDLDDGQRRIPNLPVGHQYGSPFQCLVKHVYNDLEPYICLFTDCDLGLHTFKSRREWMDHEFQLHRIVPQWCCSICKNSFDTAGSFREHIYNLHLVKLAISQIEEIVSASKRSIPCNVQSQICPFCLTAPAQTAKGFAAHVGKHQQEISLAALPRYGDASDDRSDDEDDDLDNENQDRQFHQSDKSVSSKKSSSSGSLGNDSTNNGSTQFGSPLIPFRPREKPKHSSQQFDGGHKLKSGILANSSDDGSITASRRLESEFMLKGKLFTYESLPTHLERYPSTNDGGYDVNDSEEVYNCKGCGDILEEGKALGIAGKRWHPDCFRCDICGILIGHDANILLSDDYLICTDCVYSCSVCGIKIKGVVILTSDGDENFCPNCFKCRNCNRKLEDLRYSRIAQGIFCMSCHEINAKRSQDIIMENNPLPPLSTTPPAPPAPPNTTSRESDRFESIQSTLPFRRKESETLYEAADDQQEASLSRISRLFRRIRGRYRK